ncbi:hypothetical protein D6Q91_04410 [Salmonella enterica subsp. enterica]|nr:hypothetical protein [Salmonella enterica subsp. enterica serovar Braenderup]
MGQKFFGMHESSRLNMSFNCSGAFNIIYIMRTNVHLPVKRNFKLPDTRRNKPPQLTKPRHRLLDSVMHDENNQFHQQASKPPERLTSCAVRLDDCHENPALQ